MRSQVVDRVVEDARADPAVLAVILFGSAARGETTAASDLDVCLVLDPTATDPLEHRIRYLGRHDVDLHVFQALPLPMRSRVLKEGRVLFVRDEDALYEVAFRTIEAYEDFKHTYRMYLDAVLRDGS
jgi:predicted nucleotidyltransferase